MDNKEEVDIEAEKTQSYELGHISQLNNISDELRERSGDMWAEASGRREIEKARMLKDLADEFEEHSKEKREEYNSKYK